MARSAALDIDNGAERTLIGAAASGVEARAHPVCTRDIPLRQERNRSLADRWKVVHEIVNGCQAAGCGILQQRLEPPLDLACEHSDAHLAAGFQTERLFVDHRDDTGDMEAAHGDRD